MIDASFKVNVYSITASIPKGKVMTYGDIAAVAGSPRAARQVGHIAHWGDPELPWHRIVNRHGELASAFTFGGLEGHKRALEEEGIKISNDYHILNFQKIRWFP